MTPALSELSALGVAVWLDDLSRDLIGGGDLARLVRERHVVGVTTNPTIIQKALSNGAAFEAQIRESALRGTCTDVRAACDLLPPVYDTTGGTDGRVSVEVDPRIADDSRATLAEARALWWTVDRPNLFIKIPAVAGGLPAVADALAEGISINVTLIFSADRYAQVQNAYLDGLERRLTAGHDDLASISSVASFFVSRVDTDIARRLAGLAEQATTAGDPAAGPGDRAARAGRYCQRPARLRRPPAGPSQPTLAGAGRLRRRPQRPLWASTGVKDPGYDDTRYVIDLAAAGTVNTMPAPTLQAVADHGQFRGDTITGTDTAARAVLDQVAAVGCGLPQRRRPPRATRRPELHPGLDRPD